MTEGTKSYFFGCHNFLVHPLCVLIAWRLHFKKWPKPWEVICIFLHDIGIIGKNYLSENKKGHWIKGADIANRLIGNKGFMLCRGHTSEACFHSRLFWADKKSWLVAPQLWLWWNYYIEGFKPITPPIWIELVRKEMKKEEPIGAHELYLSNKDL